MVTTDEIGNIQYSGFIPELIFQLSRRLNFKYRFYQNSSFGMFDNATQQWTGMIGEVVKFDVSRNSVTYNLVLVSGNLFPLSSSYTFYLEMMTHYQQPMLISKLLCLS